MSQSKWRTWEISELKHKEMTLFVENRAKKQDTWVTPELCFLCPKCFKKIGDYFDLLLEI